MLISFACEVCGLNRIRTISNKPTAKKPRFCGKTCKAQWQSSAFKGAANPNHGRSWDEDKREAQSRLIKSKVTSEYREQAGSANRGKTFTSERVQRMHAHRSPESYRRIHDLETRSKISLKSKEKWTEDYRIRYRSRMEANGHWMPISYQDPYRLYYKESNWIASMVEHLSESDMEKFNTFGFYGSSNRQGYVRDHIVARKIGWLFGLPSELLRHPANLQLISHRENIKKGWQEGSKTVTDLEPMINDLIQRILDWDRSWIEQDICLTLISQMKGGVGWKTFS